MRIRLPNWLGYRLFFDKRFCKFVSGHWRRVGINRKLTVVFYLEIGGYNDND